MERNATIVTLLAALVMLAGCESDEPRHVPGGDPDRGADLIRAYGCHSCHTVPGVAGAEGLVGPPLMKWQKRIYIAGRVPNTPEILVRWLMDPWEIDERTVMPDLGVTEQDARDIAAYLFTLD